MTTARILTSLGLMNGDGVGQLQLFQLLKAVVHHLSLVKLYGQLFRKGVNLTDDADIPVKHPGSGIHRNA